MRGPLRGVLVKGEGADYGFEEFGGFEGLALGREVGELYEERLDVAEFGSGILKLVSHKYGYEDCF